MPLTLGIAAGATLLQGGLGVAQYFSGQDKLKQQQPTYTIPPEIQANLSQAQIMALQGMPAEQQQQFIQQIQGGTNNAMQNLQDRGAGIRGIGSVLQSQNQAYGNLASQSSQMRLANQLRLSQANSMMAQYKDKAFDINKMQPFQRNYQEGMNETGAGMQNIGNAIGTGAGLATQGIEMSQYNKALGSMGGGQGTPAASMFPNYFTSPQTGPAQGFMPQFATPPPQNNQGQQEYDPTTGQRGYYQFGQ